MTDEPNIRAALDAFIASPEFDTALADSTKAGFSGSAYSVELFPDGTWRVVWDGQIGNLYQSPGVILRLPQFSEEDWEGFFESETSPYDYDDKMSRELHTALDMYFASHYGVRKEV